MFSSYKQLSRGEVMAELFFRMFRLSILAAKLIQYLAALLLIFGSISEISPKG